MITPLRGLLASLKQPCKEGVSVPTLCMRKQAQGHKKLDDTASRAPRMSWPQWMPRIWWLVFILNAQPFHMTVPGKKAPSSVWAPNVVIVAVRCPTPAFAEHSQLPVFAFHHPWQWAPWVMPSSLMTLSSIHTLTVPKFTPPAPESPWTPGSSIQQSTPYLHSDVYRASQIWHVKTLNLDS